MERPWPGEGTFEESEAGRYPRGDGWYVLNVADSVALAREGNGHAFRLTPRPEESGVDFMVNVRVIEPGEVSSLYHGESNQEGFLVLSGECLALVEGEERRLRPWDFFHCPPWTRHTFVGAGDGPCAVLMIGGRDPDEDIVYAVHEVAARHDAGVEEETDDPAVAYPSMGWQTPEPARRPWPPA